MKSRDVSLDIIRILACCMVVLMHSPIPSADAPGPFLTALSYLTAPCIGLFFMVSGALLLPVRQSYPEFLRSRMGRILGPTLFWTAVYVVLKLYQTPESVDLVRTNYHITAVRTTRQRHIMVYVHLDRLVSARTHNQSVD